MQGDLDEMEHMIDEYLAFARGEAGEASQSIDLKALLEAIGAQIKKRGAKVEIVAPEPSVEARVRPLAFRRALTNLAGNAADHGGRVRLSLGRVGGGVEIAVEDDGPGIPEAQREDAFRPFSRLDDARNQNTKGWAWAWPSPGTWRAVTAATSLWTPAIWAG